MTKKPKKLRLDEYILAHELLSHELILPMVMVGEVWINNQKASSIAQKVTELDHIEIRKKESEKYVSRGGYKLEAAIQAFEINVTDKVCADFGASTGGFTDALLQNGASKVYAIETGKGLLADKVRTNPRVVNWENINIYELVQAINIPPYNELLTTKVDLAVIDLSFVPLTHALPLIIQLVGNAEIIALLKPHYEAQNTRLLTKGVVKDDETRKMIVDNFLQWLSENDFVFKEIIESPIKGGGGNIEYLVHLQKTA